MGFREKYKETTARLKMRFPCPWVDEFMQYCVPCDRKKITTDDLYLEYIAFIQRKVGCGSLFNYLTVPEEILISSIHRFSKRFSYLAPSHGIRQQTTTQRGYMCKVLPLPRVVHSPPERKRMRRSGRQKCIDRESQKKPEKPAQLFKILNFQDQKGRGAFAAMDLDAGVVLTEYGGEKIDYNEGQQREIDYKERNVPMTMITVMQAGKIYCIDCQADSQGRKFEDGQNPARYFNHKKFNPNCAIKMIEEKAYLVTRRPVAAGIELRWNYDTHSTEAWINQ